MRYQHPGALAVKCRHPLHPSVSARSHYCPICLVSQARDKLEAAHKKFEQSGGLSTPPALRSSTWRSARQSYRFAQRYMDRAKMMDKWKMVKEIEWDEEHNKAESEKVDKGYGSSPGVVCPVCEPEAQKPLSHDDCQEYQPTLDRSISWWERPGMLAREVPTHSSPPPQNSRPTKKTGAIQGSVVMRNIIRKNRADLAAIGEGHQAFQSRWKTEMALREKHKLSNDFSFPDHFWQEPISGIVTRKNHQQLRATSRMSQRRARGNTPRSRPARSSLSFQESADNVYTEEDIQAEEQKEMMRRKARKVGATVGYLYFNGKPNMLDDWKEDFLRSNHTLVTRIFAQAEDSSSEMDTTKSVESEESSQSNDNRDDLSDEELMDAFLEPDMIKDDGEADPMEVDEQHHNDDLDGLGRSPIAVTIESDHNPGEVDESLDVMNVEYTNGL